MIEFWFIDTGKGTLRIDVDGERVSQTIRAYLDNMTISREDAEKIIHELIMEGRRPSIFIQLDVPDDKAPEFMAAMALADQGYPAIPTGTKIVTITERVESHTSM